MLLNDTTYCLHIVSKKGFFFSPIMSLIWNSKTKGNKRLQLILVIVWLRGCMSVPAFTHILIQAFT